MANEMHTVDAIYFGYNGQPHIQRVPIQTFAMGRGLQVPDLNCVFRTPGPTDYLVVNMQCTRQTFVVHFPIQLRPGLRPQPPLNVLVCRAKDAFQGYADCDMADATLAHVAAGFALATCRIETPTHRKSNHVLVHEPRCRRGSQ